MKGKTWFNWECSAQEENGGNRLASHVVWSRFVGISHVKSKSRALKCTDFRIILCTEQTAATASASRVVAKILNQQRRQPTVFRRRFGRGVKIFIVKERHIMSRTGVLDLVRDRWRNVANTFTSNAENFVSTGATVTFWRKYQLHETPKKKYKAVPPQLELASATNRTESYSVRKKL